MRWPATWAWAMILTSGPLAMPAVNGSEPALAPDDAAIVELVLPAGATVKIDGIDRQRQSRFTFEPLEHGRVYQCSLVVRFATGSQTEVPLLLWGGQRIRLPLLEPSERLPELMLPFHNFPWTVDVSADGRYLLTPDRAQAVLWDTATGRALRAYGGFRGNMPSCLTFRPGREQLAAVSFNDVAIFDLPTGKRLRTIRQEGSLFVTATAFSSDGRLLLAGDINGHVCLWDVDGGRRLRSYTGHKKRIRAVAFTADGRKCAAHSDDGTTVWDIETAASLRSFEGHPGHAGAILFDSTGQEILVASGGNDATKAWGDIVAWSLDGRKLAHHRTDACVQQLAWGAGGKELFASGYTIRKEGTASWLQAFKTDGLEPLREEISPRSTAKLPDAADEERAVTSAKLAAAGRTVKVRAGGSFTMFPLEIASQGGRMLARQIVCDTEPGRLVCQFAPTSRDDPHQYRIYHLSRDGSRVLAVGRRRNPDVYDLIAYDAASGKELNRVATGSQRYVSISDNGRRVLCWDIRSCSLWDMDTGREVQTWPEATTFGLSGDGALVAASLFWEKKYRTVLWDARSKQPLWASEPFDGLGFGGKIVFSPDGRHVLASHVEHRTEKSETFERQKEYAACALLDARTGKTLHRWRHGDLEYSVDRRKTDGVWKTNNRQGHSDNTRIDGAGFSPDGRFVWSWQVAGDLILLIDVRSGAVLRKITAHKSWYSGDPPVFAADSRHLAVCPGDGTAALMDIATGREVLRFVRTERGQWLATTPEGFFDGSELARQRIGYRIGEGLNVVPVDRFFQDFFRPNLFQDVLRGQPPVQEVRFARARPPLLTILSPSPGIVESPNVTIEARAEDQGGGVSKVALFHNGARMLSAGPSRQEGKRVVRTFQASLLQGDNRLKVTAANGDGSWESEPAEIVLRYEKPLARSQLHLLAVGINRYADANLNLTYAAKDAQAIAALFDRRAKTLYQTAQSQTLLDQEATKRQIKVSLKTMAGKTHPQDTLILFLAGHGTMIGQRYYFVPHELRRQAASLDDDIRSQGLPADELSELLGTAKALKRLLILDTCSSGGALGVLTRSRSGFALRGAIERLSRAQGIFSIAASSPGELAHESNELGHGLLTYSLLAGLKAVDRGPLAEKHIQPGNSERVVDVLEWFSYAAGQVPRLTEKYAGTAQDVQTSTQGSSFPLLPLEDP